MANLRLDWSETRLEKGSRKFFRRCHEVMYMANLIEAQLRSYKWFWEKGLKELFAEINSIKDFTGKNLELFFGEYFLDKPKYDEKTAKERNTTYEAPLYVSVRLVNKVTNKTKTQDVYLGDFPLMSPRGTFVINGAERVVVSQLVRSPGVYFERTADKTSDKDIFTSKVIPSRGAWLEFEIDKRDMVGVRVDRKRKQSVTVLLKALGMSEADILEQFGDAESMRMTLEKDHTTGQHDALLDIYRKLRPGEPP